MSAKELHSEKGEEDKDGGALDAPEGRACEFSCVGRLWDLPNPFAGIILGRRCS